MTANALVKRWRSFFKGVRGVRYRPMYQMRHTFASLAVAGRLCDVKTLSVLMGHKSTEMTLNRYAGYIPAKTLPVAAGLVKMISGE